MSARFPLSLPCLLLSLPCLLVPGHFLTPNDQQPHREGFSAHTRLPKGKGIQKQRKRNLRRTGVGGGRNAAEGSCAHKRLSRVARARERLAFLRRGRAEITSLPLPTSLPAAPSPRDACHELVRHSHRGQPQGPLAPATCGNRPVRKDIYRLLAFGRCD